MKKLLIILVIPLIATIFFLISICKTKYNDVTIETGSNIPSIEAFVKKGLLDKPFHFETNIEDINTSAVGQYTIIVKNNTKIKKLTLNIVDTKAPVVETKNIYKYLDYQPVATDFIVNIDDYSETKAEIIEPPTIDHFGIYNIKIKISDIYDNETTTEEKLIITRFINEFDLELGETFKKSDILINAKNDYNAISDEEIDKINNSPVGIYKIVLNIDDFEEQVNINIIDTKGPTIKLKNKTIYVGETIDDASTFVKSSDDPSGIASIKINTDINYNLINKEQEIEIVATDTLGNTTTDKAILKIIKDTIPPVFKGLEDVTINKNQNYDWKSNVYAYDAKDGNVEFTIDTSNLNISTAGTYFIKYTSKDNSNNSVTKNRKVIVKHDATDTNNEFNKYYNENNFMNKTPGQIAYIIKTTISYYSSFGDDDPIWYGLTNKKGNCYVHAKLLEKALQMKNIPCYLIGTTTGSHYWVLAYYNGVWRHYDSTPRRHDTKTQELVENGLTDEEKLSYLDGETWDTTLYPEAK